VFLSSLFLTKEKKKFEKKGKLFRLLPESDVVLFPVEGDHLCQVGGKGLFFFFFFFGKYGERRGGEELSFFFYSPPLFQKPKKKLSA